MSRIQDHDELSKLLWLGLEHGDEHFLCEILLRNLPSSATLALFLNKKKGGRAPIHAAAEHKNIEMLRFMLDKGAEIEAVTSQDRKTPLHIAADCGLPDHVYLLLSRGASLTACDKEGCMAVHCAAKCGKPRLLTVLRQHNADLNVPMASCGVTPLMWACSKGKMTFCRGLLDAGVRVDFADPEGGLTALHGAAGHGHVDIVRMLLDANASANKPRKDGTTALYFAAAGGHLEVVKLLLQRGAQASHRRNDGKTAADVAQNAAVRSVLLATSGQSSAAPSAAAAGGNNKAQKGGCGGDVNWKLTPFAPVGAPKARASGGGGGMGGSAAEDLVRWLSGLGISEQVLPVCSALGLAALPDVRLVRETDMEKLGVPPVVRRKFVEAAALVPSASAPAAGGGGTLKGFHPQPFPDYAVVGAAEFDGHAERLAAAYMRWLGFGDAALNGGIHTPDRGIDVVSSRAVAQVKANFRGTVKRPALAQLVGDASVARYQAHQLLFFAVSYAPDASAYANEAGRPVALFAFDAAGDVQPRNATAKQLVARAR